MHYTVSLKKNRDFRRLYSSGKNAANATLALYCRRNRTAENRLGITTGTKIGKAVVRNRVRRRIREAYRLGEDKLKKGWDIVIVARTRAATATYREIDAALSALLRKVGLRGDGV
jgi:ribonuclease P protein component